MTDDGLLEQIRGHMLEESAFLDKAKQENLQMRNKLREYEESQAIPHNGVIHQFSGADNVKTWAKTNFPEPEHAYNRTTVNDPSFMGGPSMRFEIKPGDRQWSVDVRTGSLKRRDELTWRDYRFAYGKEGWAGGAFYLPSDPMAKVNGCTLFQLHLHPETGVMWNISVQDGRLQTKGKTFGALMNEPIGNYLDRWVRMVVHFNPSTEDDGFVQMWLDDESMFHVKDRATKPDGDQGPYFKNGLYYWGYEKFDRNKHAVAYFDRLRIADERGSYDLVDPAKW